MARAAQIPSVLSDWFTRRGWRIRPHQRAMLRAYAQGQSTLLIAPTGAGKTMAGFLASLGELAHGSHAGLHTLYVSPLKALTNDIERNLLAPIRDMQLPITVETRTGDTPSHKRQRQRKRPPHILLTTPESLMLMLSYAEAPAIFGTLRLLIVDEIHSLAPNKRGDFMALAMARLQHLAPQHVRFGLSATVAEPVRFAQWLGVAGYPATVVTAADKAKPRIRLLCSNQRMPYGGFSAKYAVPDIYRAIAEVPTSIVFVNTRAQAELMFRFLWEVNEQALPIAVYHGSLSKEQRRRTETLMAQGKLRCVVSTSALELGIDWGDVSRVIQVGAPKGVSRLLQRIGRSNHRMDEASEAWLVPSNRFELLECEASIAAIKAGRLDGEALLPGSEEIIVQYIVNCACSAPITPEDLFAQVTAAAPYTRLARERFDKLFRFAVDGGYVLQHYERYQRLIRTDDGSYRIASRSFATRHRQNIGVIVEAARIKVKRLNPRRGGRIIGEVEESFAQQLTPGDTFSFAGEVLAYVGIRDLMLEARPSAAPESKVPSYAGGQMPLSTFLADGVRHLLSAPQHWRRLPPTARDWLELQQQFSLLPDTQTLLVEHFPRRGMHYTMIYSFEGRKANQTLGMLVTRRMERLRLRPLSFSVTDYALSITTLKPFDAATVHTLLSADIMAGELEEWIVASPMLKRSFRRVAMITGITEQRHAGDRKSMKQVTFSTDLIYDVLLRHEPDHVLLDVTRADAERELLDTGRLADWLLRFSDRITFQPLTKPSPLSIPILTDVRREPIRGEGLDALLDELTHDEEAERLMDDIRDDMQKRY